MVQKETLIIRGGMGYIRDSSEAWEERILNETNAQQRSLWIQISVLDENTLDLQTNSRNMKTEHPRKHIFVLMEGFGGYALQHFIKYLIGSPSPSFLNLPLHYSALFDKFIKHQKSLLCSLSKGITRVSLHN